VPWPAGAVVEVSDEAVQWPDGTVDSIGHYLLQTFPDSFEESPPETGGPSEQEGQEKDAKGPKRARKGKSEGA